MNVIKHFVNNSFANANPELNNKYYILVKKKNVGNSEENEKTSSIYIADTSKWGIENIISIMDDLFNEDDCEDNATIDNYYTFREFHIDKNCKNSIIITKIGKYELNLYTLKLLALNRLGSQYLDDIANGDDCDEYGNLRYEGLIKPD